MKIFARAMISILVTSMIAVGAAGCVKAQGFFGNPLVGKKAPNFILDTLQGKKFSLEEAIAGKKAIIFFWSTWCPHCREQLNDMNAKKEQMEKNGVTLVLVDIGESPEVVRKFVMTNRIGLDVVMDVESYAAEMYQVVGIPTMVFIGDDGKVRYSLHGLPDEYMELLK